MEIDMERTVSEENASTTTVKDALEKAVHIYKNYIMTNTSKREKHHDPPPRNEGSKGFSHFMLKTHLKLTNSLNK